MSKKKEKVKREKKPLTYVEAHNRAVSRYRRYVTSFLFIGIFNVIGAIFFLIQINVDLGSFSGDFLCVGLDMFIFMIPQFSNWLVINLPWSSVIYLVIFLGTGALICWWAVEARLGKKIYLYISAAYYLVDWIFTILLYVFFDAFQMSYFISTYSVYLMLLIHLLITIFIVLAFYQFYRVYTIEEVREHPEKAKLKRGKRYQKLVEESALQETNKQIEEIEKKEESSS